MGMDTKQPLDQTEHTIFELVHKGMNVYDRSGDHIGHVEQVYFGEDASTTQDYSAGAATASDPSVVGSNLVVDVAEAIFGEDPLPETLRHRLLKEGFIQVNGSLFASDRYVLREQIASISGDDVHLNVTKDELIKR
jgi:hypothetical protein